MTQVRWLSFKPDREVWLALAVAVGGIAVLSGALRAVPPDWRTGTVSLLYSVWLGLALAYAYRASSLTAVGLTGRRFLPGAIAAVAVGLLGVAGSLQDPSMVGARQAYPGTLRLLTMLLSTMAPAFAEQLVIGGYVQLRVEAAFGRLAGVLAYAVLFTVFHVALVWLPGAVPPASAGMAQFVLGIFIASSLFGLVLTLARNVWALALGAGLNALGVNLYLLSVRPGEVLVANPRALISGVPLVLGWLLAIWLTGKLIRDELPVRVPLRRIGQGR